MRRTVIIAAALAVLVLGAAMALRPSGQSADRVVRITARRFEYNPSTVTLKKGVPVTLELTSLDRHHGFKLPELGIRADVKPGAVTRVRIVPHKTGHFAFRCDVFCGGGHEDMSGEIIVVD